MARTKSTKRKIHFSPDNLDVIVTEGENLLQAALSAGVRLTASCGGNGTCGTCKLVIEEGQVETKRTTKISDAEFKRGVRQACQSRVITDLAVSVPVESRLERSVIAHEKKEAPGAIATGWNYSPPYKKYFIELVPPRIDENMSDLTRLLKGLKSNYRLANMTVDFEMVKKLSNVLRDGDWKVTVSTLVTAARARARESRRPVVMDIEAGDARNKYFCLAFDIGTTTVWGQLLDLNKGRVMAQSARYNGQISYGGDVITRIAHTQKPDGLNQLQGAVITTMNEVINDLLAKSKIDRQSIGHITIAGNTTMTHILLGLDPKHIRLAPYTPTATFFPPIKAASAGIDLGEHVHLFTSPSVSSYVGGDIVSGVVGCGMHQRTELTLYIDIGTNGEAVIGNSDWMVTASCSAGPAFEGGGIKDGVLATAGAIEDIEINAKTFEPSVRTISNEKPKGICGSGLINTVASLLETRIISPNGKFNTDLGTGRVREGSYGYEYVLSRASETQVDRDIVITEADIDNLMRAKGAMYAGFQTLAKVVGLDFSDLDRIIIAGSFGNSININSAITVGLLPDIARDKFTFIGNGSLLGARLISFSTDILDDARKVADMMTNIELSENTDFMNNYIASLFLPHTDMEKFPSVTPGKS